MARAQVWWLKCCLWGPLGRSRSAATQRVGIRYVSCPSASASAKGARGAARWGPDYLVHCSSGTCLTPCRRTTDSESVYAPFVMMSSRPPSLSSSNAETPHPNPMHVAAAGEHLDIASISDQVMQSTYRVSSISAYAQPFPTAFLSQGNLTSAVAPGWMDA